MRVAINIAPLSSGHKERGIGYYTSNLISGLEKIPGIDIIKFKNGDNLKNIDVVHYPWFDFYFHTLPIIQKFPTVVTIHDVMPLIFPNQFPVGLKGKLNFHLQKIALKKCKFIITDSLVSKKDIIDYLKIKEEKIVVIPLAPGNSFKELSDSTLIRVKRKYNLPEKFLFYVGDGNYIKNLPFLIEGFRKLIQDQKYKDIKLVLAGNIFVKKLDNIDHPELESIKKTNELITKLGLENFIIRPGFLSNEDLVAFFNLAFLYIQPSLYEGFGLPILQAMACGTPVISSNAGSLPEISGDAAIFFNPNNLDDFLNRIKMVIQDKSIQYQMVKKGLKQAALFSWNKVAADTLKVYKDSISR